MPVPKKRQSKSKSNTRKSVWKKEALKEIKRALSKGRRVLEAAKNTSSFETRQGRKPSLGFGSKQQDTATSRNRRKPKRNGK